MHTSPRLANRLDLGIIGSRKLTKEQEEYIKTWIMNRLCFYYLCKDITIVSGGAKGVDSIAEKIADKHKYPKIIFKPDFSDGYHVSKYFERNDKIIDYSDEIIIFWDGKSRGTKYVIDQCEKKDKRHIIVRINKTRE